MEDRINRLLEIENAFDFKKRNLLLGEKRAVFTYIIGYIGTLSTENILRALMNIQTEKIEKLKDLNELAETYLPFGSCEVTSDPQYATEEILRGSASLTVEGFSQILLMDVRDFPMRGIEEPEKDRTLRGPHIGTNESLISNIIQIRRYLRCTFLRTEKYLLGKEVKNEVAILSLKGKCDEKFLERIRNKIQNANIPNLSITQEGLSNLLFPRKGLSLLNPFPKIRFTERPDVVAASLMEGKIAILCDNSPSVILLPQSIFDFFEEADDYYFPPLTASYLRLVRLFVFLSSIFTIPIWLLLVQNSKLLPGNFSFVLTDQEYAVPLFLQFLIIEFAIDGLKMASLNTPTTLSGSFSVIGGLLLGEYAVKSGWFIPQAILYSAFTGIANFIPTNIELGYCFKFMRISLILLVEFFGIKGFLLGIIFWLITLCSTKGVGGKSYLYPFIPFDKTGVKKIIFKGVSGREKVL